MVFSSSALYVDPPNNWNQQAAAGSNNNIVVNVDEESIDHHELPQPHHDEVAAASATAVPNSSSSCMAAERARLAKIPQVEAALKCPRCDSTNTKFCYFNNYSLTQPRHFCKTCRRYWTRGGALRSVPVGGGCRRNKRGSNKSSSNSACNKLISTPPASSASTSSSAAAAAAAAFRTVPQFLAPWHHHLPADYGGGLIQQLQIDHQTMPAADQNNINNIGLMEQWRNIHQQFPFFGGLVEPSMMPLYPFEGELGGGHGKMIMSTTVKMEDQTTSQQAAAANNMPRQFFNVGRNDGQIWPGGGGDTTGSGEAHGGGWIN